MTPLPPRDRRPGLSFDDPFGTRPDEKPPAGWDEALWNGVRRRIEERRGLPGSDEPPPPAGRRPVAIAVALWIGASMLAAGMVLHVPQKRLPPPPAAPDSTLVQVEGTPEPDVSVEWARRSGRRAGYVVVESLDPRLSCILIDPPVTRR